MKIINYLIIYLFIITILWVFTPISAPKNGNEAESSNSQKCKKYRKNLKEKRENIDKADFIQIKRIYCPDTAQQKELINYYNDPKFQEARELLKINRQQISIFEKIEPKLWIPYIRGLLVLYVYGEVGFDMLPVFNKLFQRILHVFKFSSINIGGKRCKVSDEIANKNLQILKNQIDKKMYLIKVTAESVKNVYEFNGKKLNEDQLNILKQVEEEEKQQQRENNSGLYDQFNINVKYFDLNEQPED